MKVQTLLLIADVTMFALKQVLHLLIIFLAPELPKQAVQPTLFIVGYMMEQIIQHKNRTLIL